LPERHGIGRKQGGRRGERTKPVDMPDMSAPDKVGGKDGLRPRGLAWEEVKGGGERT